MDEQNLSKPPHLQSDELDDLEKVEPILQFFRYTHLPLPLQAVSVHFFNAAYALVGAVKRNPERTVALRKLLEAKDAGVRALIYKEPPR